MKRTVLFLILLLLSMKAGAQITANRQPFVSVEGGWTGSSFGALASYGQYTMTGYWSVGAVSMNRVITMLSPAGEEIENMTFLHTAAYGDYMFRVFGLKNRKFNVYGGADVFLGIETLDTFGQLKHYPLEKTNLKKVAFLYGLSPKVELEGFIVRNIAVVASCRMPLYFSEQLGRVFNWECCIGLRVNL